MMEAGLLGNLGRQLVLFLFWSAFQAEQKTEAAGTVGPGLMLSASLFPVFLVSRRNQASSLSFCLCPYRVYRSVPIKKSSDAAV